MISKMYLYITLCFVQIGKIKMITRIRNKKIYVLFSYFVMTLNNVTKIFSNMS